MKKFVFYKKWHCESFDDSRSLIEFMDKNNLTPDICKIVFNNILRELILFYYK